MSQVPIVGSWASVCVPVNGRPELAKHNPRMTNYIRQDLVIARQGPQLLAGLLVQVAKSVGRQIGREPIRFGKNDVKADD